ncbi:hypothetical protein KP509_16G002500 [Ceratopteris richardii]|uniref:EF-hand domain-containing protein n=1 Tax=Ceratopteris richardii TaxID=49495 RepID=A0A8T2SWB8_CERRI|nr:hypothetical protein KP509_16G002500 [Ceratopteris richardii]
MDTATVDVHPSSHGLREQALFDQFDGNRDGKISQEEIASKMHSMGLSISQDELKKLMAESGANTDGLIDYEGFVRVYRDLMGKNRGGSGSAADSAAASALDDDADGSLKEAFQVFDADRNGLISAQELHDALKSIDVLQGRNLSDCEAMIKRVDSDGNGQVDYEEFKAMMD